MDKEKFDESVKKAKKILKLDRDLRKKAGKLSGTAEYFADYRSNKRTGLRDVGLHKHTSKLAEKQAYEKDLEAYLIAMFKEKFTRPFSDDQKKFIKQIQTTILNGGQYAIALPRGEGKTTIVTCSVIWAILYGHRRFIVIVSADRRPADRLMSAIKKMLADDRLGELFPECQHYVKALAGLSQRASGQLADGKPTYITWKAGQINLPYVPMDETYLERCSGAVIVSAGITCGIRGLQETLPNGEVIRPDFLFLDDISTRESAGSSQQNKDRMSMLKSDLLPLAGIGKELACIMACTVIEADDLSDQILSEWQSIRAKALYTLPAEHNGLWKEYIDLYRASQKHGDQVKDCNEFYLKNRERLDRGAVVGNPYRLNEVEISALQSCYNFLSKYGERSFWSELQNSPKETTSSIFEIKPSIVSSRINHIPRYEMPPECNFLVIYADLNYIGLNYVVTAFKNDMTAYVIDADKHPQGRSVLIDSTEEETTTGAQKISRGILDFVSLIYKQKRYTKNGVRVMPNRILIDANFMTSTVHSTVKALQRSRYPVICDRGRSYKQYKPARQDKLIGKEGNNLFVQKGIQGEEIVHNSDYWRMVTQKAFLLSPGQPGSISLWGDKSSIHEDISYEICSEKLVKYSAQLNMYEWHKQVNERNDKLDALVGCYVGASSLGGSITGGERMWRQRKQVKRISRKPTVNIED